MASLLKAAHARAAEVAKLSGGSLLLGLSGKDATHPADYAKVLALFPAAGVQLL
jgi:hypothetical protein